MNHATRCTKNGKLMYRCDYVGSDGRRHFKFLPTAEVAEDFLARATLESRQPTHSDLPSTMTLAQYAQHWRALARTHLKPRTLLSYDTTLRLHVLPAFGATRLRDLQRGRIKTFLAGKLDDHKPNSVRIVHATLRTILNAAVDDGLIVANPADKLGRALKLVTKTLVRQQHIKAMDRAQRDTFLATVHRLAPWWAAMWEVQVLSGLRPGEVCALHDADLDLDAATARITRTLADDGLSVGSPKGNRGRTIDLSARAVAVLRSHRTARKAQKLQYGWSELPAPLFCSAAGTYPNPGRMRTAFRRVVTQAGLPHFTPHSLRHTYASLLLQAGTDVYYVSRMLGHASIKETVDTYGRWLPANRKGALDVLDPPAVTTDRVTNL
jgi:integrase